MHTRTPIQAVIWEGFRMRPAVTYGHYKVVPPGGDTIAGMWVPGGTAIGHCHYGMMRNKQIFGDDVEVFRPERYLDEPNGEEMRRTVELVFGTGRWMCAGKQVALMELNKIFWEVSRRITAAALCEEMIAIFGSPAAKGVWML